MADDGLLLLEDAAAKLEPLLGEVVFVGGSVLALLITDEAAAPVRSTLDVDVVAAVTTYAEYTALAERLRALGFGEDARDGAPLCRWLHGALVLDLMPVEPVVLGFSNRWYGPALDTAEPVPLPSGAMIRLIRAPLFLASKMEAFRGRGKRDFYASRDLEDFVAVVDGRESLTAELAAASTSVRAFLGEAARELLSEPRFRDALPGYLLPDAASQQRIGLVLERLGDMSLFASV